MLRRFFGVLLFCFVISYSAVTSSFAQKTDVPNGPPQKTYTYKDIGLSIRCTDDDSEGLFVTVRKNKRTLFKHTFEDAENYKPPFRINLDTTTKAFLFRTWSGGAHCCETIYLAIFDSKQFRIVDTLFILDGHFTFKTDSAGKKIIAADIDHFPYEWTCFAGSEYNFSFYSIEKNGFHDITPAYPNQVLARVKRFQKNIQKIEYALRLDSKKVDKQALGDIKQNLACLLYAYASINRGTEGWDIIRKKYKYSDKNKYISELKSKMENLSEHKRLTH